MGWGQLNFTFLDLDRHTLAIYMECTIKRIVSSDTASVAPVNLMLSSLFDDVQLSINDRIVESGEHLYPYKSYITNLLTRSSHFKKFQLTTSGFVKDHAGKFDDKTNIGHVTRAGGVKALS